MCHIKEFLPWATWEKKKPVTLVSMRDIVWHFGDSAALCNLQCHKNKYPSRRITLLELYSRQSTSKNTTECNSFNYSINRLIPKTECHTLELEHVEPLPEICTTLVRHKHISQSCLTIFSLDQLLRTALFWHWITQIQWKTRGCENVKVRYWCHHLGSILLLTPI